ncbi:zinc-ribbon domain-containing protein [Enorma phocaeensis]|uniref:zinc-ribbon domain-containing protein n=1 Tax=Enorma phocaeensis TaxID=1871019 RepID=UPI002355E478|nr:zinc-ribbon domain-containing protein [Enorma phocaeensis]
MFCSQCGSQIPDSVAFCPACGAATGNASAVGAASQTGSASGAPAPQPIPATGAPAPQPLAPAGSQPMPGIPGPQPAPGAWNQQPAPSWNAANQVPYPGALGMNWYKFIIWFQLFASALLALGNAIRLFTGMNYDGSARAVYLMFGGLQALDIVTGLFMLVLAAAAVFIRFELSGFKRDAPLHYLIYLGVSLAANLAYTLLFAMIVGAGLFDLIDAPAVGNAIGLFGLIVLSKIYFDKRKAMFCN